MDDFDRATGKDIELELWLRKRNSGKIKWKMKSGEYIDIRDMEDSHLENTLRMINRNRDMYIRILDNYSPKGNQEHIW